MKNWIRCIVLTLILIAVAPMSAAAESSRGILDVNGNDVALTLHLPEGKTESITSLRVTLRISAVLGTMDAPRFQFKDSVTSLIQDAQIRSLGDNRYLADIILSGKKNQNIFAGSEDARIGTLSLNPTSKDFQIKVEFYSDTENEEGPVVKYMDSSGLEEMKLLLGEANGVQVQNSQAEEVKPPTGDAQQESDNKNPINKPKLKASVISGSKCVMFQWKEIQDVSGYEIYQYDSKTEKYKKLKTIKDSKVTAWSKKFKYAVTYNFQMRAFKLKEDGSRIYSEYSSNVKRTLPPTKAKKISIKNKNKKKPSLTWSKVPKAKGYQIYRSTEKKGKYKLLKTIKKGNTTKLAVNKPKSGTVYYYKVKAYVTGSKGKRIYGNFSPTISLK